MRKIGVKQGRKMIYIRGEGVAHTRREARI